MSYLDLSIQAIHQALIKKEITPLELTKEALKRAKEDTHNSFETILETEALAFAASLKEPEVDNLLWGIPYVAKDNIATKDIETTASSKMLEGFIALFNATVIEKLTQKKAILIGKTTLDELGMGATGTSGKRGPTLNPRDPNHVSIIGGSSCGSAAAVSGHIVPFALATDTGDSIRKPASYGGIVGHKPSWGRISRFGVYPYAPSLDHVGVLTRSVKDAAIVCQTISGYDENDATSLNMPPLDLTKLNEETTPLKIAIIKDIVEQIDNQVIKQKFSDMVAKLKALGHHIELIDFRKDLLDAVYPVYMTISCAESVSNNANLDGLKFGLSKWFDDYQQMMRYSRNHGFSRFIKRRFIIGSLSLRKEFRHFLFDRAQKGRRLIVNQLDQLFNQFDLIIAPTAPSTAPLLSESSERVLAKVPIVESHLILANLAGLPSISVPLAKDHGLPFGFSITGRRFDEKSMFNLAISVQKLSEFDDFAGNGATV